MRVSAEMVCSENTAVMSQNGRYRYMLTRELCGMDRPLTFIMLNPSTADAQDDDPTIRRCIGFANRERAHSLIVVNLYAWRATKPKDLPMFDNAGFGPSPVGPDNDACILRAARGSRGRVVCAWGANAERSRILQVCTMLRQEKVELMCLGTTKHGQPRHPLYVKADQPLIRYTGDTA